MAIMEDPSRPLGAQKLPALIPRLRRNDGITSPSEPGPETPLLPPPANKSELVFCKPRSVLLLPKDIEIFSTTSTYRLITGFIFGMADSVRGRSISSAAKKSPAPIVVEIITILDEAEQVLSAYPPEDTGSRFGNPAFRSFLKGVAQKQHQWHAEQLHLEALAIEEASTYLQSSFGSGQRIDYGSGHELNFALWLLCLNRLGMLQEAVFPELVLLVFPRYLKLIRAVQAAYYLEPAGSHGVWGLDDYQFLPFLFGASQLVGHRYITPKGIHNQLTVEESAHDYLYLNQVAFVNSVKNVDGLRWHSPMLDDISAAKSWDKIEAGLRKMFIKEVLGKLPVMQHFLFGSLIPVPDGMSQSSAELLKQPQIHDHDHDVKGKGWDDCCGIRVPGAVGAAEELKKRMGQNGLRRLPFD